MELSEYQRRALETSQVGKADDPETAVAPLLGLASGVGSLLNTYKRFLRDKEVDIAANREFLREELGDILWYTAVVSATFGFDLGEISERNLKRTQDRYGTASEPHDLGALPIFDADYPRQEQFPRRLVIEFRESDGEVGPIALMILQEAAPNEFPDGKIQEEGGKGSGYTVGKQLGAELTDNSPDPDGYRFHDAIHFGLMAVLGWSPTIRELLRVKRKSRPEVDESEDGARAIFLEEGVSAALAQLSKKRSGFVRESAVDGEVLDIVTGMTSGFEVAACPQWLWRQAIHQGFFAFSQLVANRGGVLIADLDARTLAYEPPRAE